MERAAEPGVLLNWRFQQMLYRAYYDAYLRDRLIRETAAQSDASSILRTAGRIGSLRAIDEAETILDSASTRPVSPDRRARVFELAEALFQRIRLQTSVGKYKAIALGRGTHLDTIDVPLNDRFFLEKRFAAIRMIPNEEGRIQAIDALLNRADPGPGGFYDDLGDPNRQPHLVRKAKFADDPDFRMSHVIGFARRPDWPMAWCQNAQSLVDNSLDMHYDGLDPKSRYKVRVVYAGDSPKTRIRLDADGKSVHPLIEKPDPVAPVEYDLPAESTSDGKLDLRWHREPGLGGNGRGCHVAEVWIMQTSK